MPAATPLTFGSLFAGIGGMDLGLERSGWKCRWQVEIDDYARRILAKHWPDVRRHDDVRTFPPDDGADWTVDLIAGGFPCQDISIAGPGGGLDGERSGLWREFRRVLRLLRPRYALIENVSAITVRGMGSVLADLAALGFDAEWSMLPACAVGAPHTRQRMFIVAHTDQKLGQKGLRIQLQHGRQEAIQGQHDQACKAHRARFMDAILRNRGGHDGVPDRVDRIGALGNAVVPAVAEWIGRRLMEIAS